MVKTDGIDVLKVPADALILPAKVYWNESVFHKAFAGYNG